MDTLHNTQGQRKYLTKEELIAFLVAAERAGRNVRTFCGLLVYSGCRISEALALTVARVDLVNHAVTFESLKKRKRGIFRTVPLPSDFVDTLDLVHGIREAQRKDGGNQIRLWTWHRSTAWRKVKQVMVDAKITTSAATPKGLRHGYGVNAVTSNVPLNMLQKWLGHAALSTTAIYANALGEEERSIASKMWED